MAKGRKKIVIPKEDIDKIEAMAARGLTEEQIFHNLGYKRDVFYLNKKSNPDISDAIKRGQNKGIALVSNIIFDKAIKGNVTAAIFYLKCRAGWKETQVIETNDDKNTDKGKYEATRSRFVDDILQATPERDSQENTSSRSPESTRVH